MSDVEIHSTAIVGDDVVLGEGTRVGAYVVIEDGVRIGAGNVLWPRAFVGRGTTLGDGNEVHPGAVIGHVPQDLSFDPDTPTFTRIGDRNMFRENCAIHRATKEGEATEIGNDNMFMAFSHVAHDCKVGNNVILVNFASLTGHCVAQDRVIMSGFTGMHQFCRIGRLAFVSALSVSNKDLPPFFVHGGRPALSESVNVVGLRRAGIGPEVRGEIKDAYRLLYRSGLPISEALTRIRETCSSDEARELVQFIEESKRGIALGMLEGSDTLSTKPHRAGTRRPHGERPEEEAE